MAKIRDARRRVAKAGPKLERRETGAYYVVQYVPRPLVAVYGRRKLVKSLGTHNRLEAERASYKELAAWAAEFDLVRRTGRLPGATQDDSGAVGAPLAPDLLGSAMRTRKALDRARAGDQGAVWTSLPPDPGQTPLQKAIDVAEIMAAEEADDLAITHGPEVADTYSGIVHGTRTPLLHLVDAWLAEGGPKGRLTEKTAAQYRADLKRLAGWLKQAGIPATLQAVTKQVVGRYVHEAIVAKGIGWATGNRIITAPASYWKWLLKRGYVETSPWVGASLAKDKKRKKPRRAFTREEVSKLLDSNPTQDMRDLIMFGALTGMRIGEIVGLRIADCRDGWFTIPEGREGSNKTENAARRVPIHPDLLPVVERLSAGKKPDDYLLPWKGDSDTAGKRFMRFRIAAGVDVRQEGKRQSETTYHSLRHFFTTEARNAGIDRYVVDVVTGHAADGETDGRYHSGPTDELLKRCVEAVRLPNT